MDRKTSLKPLAAALGTTFAVSLAASPLVNAAENPFAAFELSRGYMVAGDQEGKCGSHGGAEATDAGDKSEEGKCGGGAAAGDADKGGEDPGAGNKGAEGKCGG